MSLNAHALVLSVTETVTGGFVITWQSSPYAWQRVYHVSSADELAGAVKLIQRIRNEESN
jgi:hypothetical protein